MVLADSEMVLTNIFKHMFSILFCMITKSAIPTYVFIKLSKYTHTVQFLSNQLPRKHFDERG